MADQEFSGEVDLFGCPIIIRDAKQGRPPHVRTPENANKVILLFALGRTVPEVAQALGITQPTLRKHYFSECEQRDAMALRLEADQLLRLHRLTLEGNVAASRELLSRVDRVALRRLATDLPTDRRRKAERKAPAKGKKEEQQEAAKGVGGLFGTRPPPPAAKLN